MQRNNKRNKTTNKESTESNTELETNNKLNIWEKLIIKKLIKQAKKKLNNYKKKAKHDLNERIKIEQALLKIGESFEIIDLNTNEEINNKSVKELTEKELLKVFEQALNALKKEI